MILTFSLQSEKKNQCQDKTVMQICLVVRLWGLGESSSVLLCGEVGVVVSDHTYDDVALIR